jgi:translation initiation factor 3 subunit M
LEGSVNIICHIVPRIPPPGTVSAAAALASGLAVPTASKPEHRLQALVNLYNVVYEPQSKLAVLVQTLAFSKACGLADVMLGVVRTHADTWARDLGLSPEDERALYVACADALRACTRKPKTAAKEAYRLLTKHLTTFEGSSLPEAASAASVASEVVAEFLRSPEMFTFDLGDSPAVVALAQNAQHAPLHRLLTVYLSGTVADFREVAAAHPQLFDTLGVTAEAALNKMQLLALMGLAHGTDELGFGAIATALDVAIEDVENIVVQAVGRRLLEARIDQLRSTVTVLRCSPRTFGAAQWRELQAQLRSWNETVSHVVEMGCDDQKVLQQGISELRVSVA